MPIKDPERRKEVHQQWIQKRMQEGYGKALYARRKQRWNNEEILRRAVENALAALEAENPARAAFLLQKALERAPQLKGKPLDTLKEINE